MSTTLPSPKPSQGTLGKRLLTTFAVVLTLSLLGSLIGIWSLRQIQQSTETMVSQGVATERLVADAYRYQAINSERYKAIALSSEPEVATSWARTLPPPRSSMTHALPSWANACWWPKTVPCSTASMLPGKTS